jgi:Flp pilus assembly protein TadG
MKKCILLLVLLGALQSGRAQELQARFSVVANLIGNNVDKKVFGTLQSALLNFVNNRKWTTETFQPQERIKCNFLLNLDKALGDNVYKATLTVQAARPVYNYAIRIAGHQFSGY